jgi:fatty-acyl-CoA synthase
MLDHGEARILLTDREFSKVVGKALTLMSGPKPLVIDVEDATYQGGEFLGEIEYEAFLGQGDENFRPEKLADEWDAIALNYTSGTTGNPKGVVYHHRGAYLNAVSNIVTWGMQPHSVYLWTLPMFHCNGWCFPWTMAANVGVNVCLRRIDPKTIFEMIAEHKVTHFCGAPIVHGMLIALDPASHPPIDHKVEALIAGAAPPAAIIEGMEKLGVGITHVYGLTETYGPASVCAKQAEWETLPLEKRAELNGRQGVRSMMQEAIDVVDAHTMVPVPHDGATMGEIVFRGNIVMKGYLKNEKATISSFEGGWFRTGDLAVIEPDGYIKIKDRSKDIIISGGENISSLEVEDVLYRHKDVLAAAVVAAPDEKWGEVPVAFVELREDATPTQEEFLEFCREHMARFKVPKRFLFGALPKTSTGKIQKFILREKAREDSDAVG